MMHVAMSDAINSVQGRYTRSWRRFPPRQTRQPRPRGGGGAADPAPALPNSENHDRRSLRGSLKAIPEGPAKTQGIALGEQVAAAVQADRATDGTNVPDTYRPLTSPGVWVPTTPPMFPQYARAKPWVLKSADQFRPGPPPQLSSALYARDYNETKTFGGAKSTTRTAAQTEAVRFWTQPNLGPAWQAARANFRRRRDWALPRMRVCSRCLHGHRQYLHHRLGREIHYNFWRPVTAIRNGDMDGNDATERDPGGTPLNATPMHPEYPSQAAITMRRGHWPCIESVFGAGPVVAVTATDTVDARLQRQFTTVAHMGEEQRFVRIWGGIHFRNTLEVGHDMGKKPTPSVKAVKVPVHLPLSGKTMSFDNAGKCVGGLLSSSFA